MKIYHGTRGDILESILTKGIQPRRRRGRGNWKDCPSKPGFVYLTTAYPGYFAYIATQHRTCKTGTPLLLLEIETDRLNERLLFPDEDFIAHALLRNRRGGRLSGVKKLDDCSDLIRLTNLIRPG